MNLLQVACWRAEFPYDEGVAGGLDMTVLRAQSEYRISRTRLHAV